MLVALLLVLTGGIVLLLLARASAAPPTTDRKLAQRLIELAVQDHGAATRLLREHPELLEARYVFGETSLHLCAVEGFTEGVRFLVAAGVPIDAPNEFGDTALVDAVAAGNLAMVKLLLRHGANPEAASRTRGSVLHDAVKSGYAEVAEALLGAGARTDYVTGFGETVWDAVPTKAPRREEILAVLERHGVRRFTRPAGSVPGP
jgi:ankyrin repeat protein